MRNTDRRKFLKQTGAGIAASVASVPRAATARDANDRLVVGVIGCGGRGTSLGRTFSAQPDARVAHVCDPDRTRAARAKDAAGADQAAADMRVILDDKAVDAVIIASCDHWHAPAAILACKAGEHVYVEKPCSHNVREGRLMVEAARRHDVVMQHGTQSRSSPGRQKAVQLLRDGTIGKVLIAKHVNSQRRANIGHRSPSGPPRHLECKNTLEKMMAATPNTAFSEMRSRSRRLRRMMLMSGVR
jgi:predicted dehydrogenase